jgi:hypothetical protein
LAAVAAVGALGLILAAAAGNAAQPREAAPQAVQRAGDGCRPPRLKGLTLARARARAARAGCRLAVVNGQVRAEEPAQLVARQAHRSGRQGRLIRVWLVPLCAQVGAPGPPAGEPIVTTGPTELISGLYVAGGALLLLPICRPGVSSAGTITIVDPATGAIVASATVATGQLATFPLAPGTYAIEATFADASTDGLADHSIPQSVTIPAGKTVRQDTVVSVP